MAAFRDMEELCQGLLSLLGANHAAAQQRRLLGRYGQMMDRLLDTQDRAEQQLREILKAEKDVAQSLLDVKEQACQGVAELQQIEAKLQKASEEDTHLKASLLQLTRELEDLKEIEADLEKQEKEVDEDTTVTIPAAIYVAQLYHRISKIEWDYECEPGMIKGTSEYFTNKFLKAISFHWGSWRGLCGGFPYIVPSVHRGPSVAQPIHLDSTQLSKKFISDYLWSLVDTEW
ncbi:PREDICTED: kinetochore protein Spc24 isoform X2 [Miniopterus natalensis]|uniref:kinetochore protein Spc24 isoform X2 n=1 Tax=Miniopterus natalensis TaxID=291302 RepID=UPI0007A72F03|nr:PREDICTED: kinetochore protein Spc24 isoform X2 [Miniopterus natalensis]